MKKRVILFAVLACALLITSCGKMTTDEPQNFDVCETEASTSAIVPIEPESIPW